MKPKNRFQFEEIAAVILLTAMLFVLTFQVIGRYFFHYTTTWSEESARYMLVWFVVLSASMACYYGAHIKVDAAMRLFPRKIRPYIELAGLAIFSVYALIITYYSARFTLTMLKTGQISLGMHIRMWFVYAVIPIGHFLMVIRNIGQIAKKIRSKCGLE